MSQPYVGQIMIFGGNFAPAGWMLCAGQLLPISEYDTLFSLIGTTYGGDGQSTFGLPNLQGRVPLHMGQGNGLSSYIIGQAGGVESVTLTTQQIPIHNHMVQVYSTPNSQSNATTPAGNVVLGDLGQSSGKSLFTYGPLNNTNQVPLAQQSIGFTGGSQPHENRQALLVLNFIISLFGVYPSQN
jgi:microcystin-dependent protein